MFSAGYAVRAAHEALPGRLLQLQTGLRTHPDECLQRVETGSLTVVEFDRRPFETIATYAAEPPESNFTPSSRSSPLGDTCR
jgi:hypothetical protein